MHYYQTGATIYGTEAKVGYEYDGKKYVGRFAHMPNVRASTDCHLPHGGQVKIDRCGGCHDGGKSVATSPEFVMSMRGDFEGNGKAEGLAREIFGAEGRGRRCCELGVSRELTDMFRFLELTAAQSMTSKEKTVTRQ